MIINEGEKIPFWYLPVRHAFEYNGTEVQPIPYCWIKRLWYWLLRKTKISKWERNQAGMLVNEYLRGKEDGAHLSRRLLKEWFEEEGLKLYKANLKEERKRLEIFFENTRLKRRLKELCPKKNTK